MEYKILTKDEFENWIDQFCKLYKKCFSGPINEDIVRWRYLDNPFDELLVCVAIDNGRLVANIAASPCEIVNNGKIEKSAISINLMTDPNYRGMGIFVDIASKLYEYMENQGFKSVFGFPNYLSHPTFVEKLGRVTIYEIPTLKLILSEFRKKLRISSQVIQDDSFEYNYSSYKHRSKTIYLNKNREYLRWRYHKNPLNKYRNFVILDNSKTVRSYLICKEYHEQLNIVDYCFQEEKDIELLIERAIDYANNLGKESVTVWSQIGTEEHLVFEKLGFRNNYPVTYFSGKLFGSTDGFDSFYDYRNWFINMGDDNVY